MMKSEKEDAETEEENKREDKEEEEVDNDQGEKEEKKTRKQIGRREGKSQKRKMKIRASVEFQKPDGIDKILKIKGHLRNFENSST